MIYEFFCEKCGKKYEKYGCSSEDSRDRCPECGHTSNRVISSGSFILKGDGFYKKSLGDGCE